MTRFLLSAVTGLALATSACAQEAQDPPLDAPASEPTEAEAETAADEAPPVDLAQVQHSEQAQFRVVTLAEGLDLPWALAFLPGGDILITEKTGALRIYRDGELDQEPLRGLPDDIFAENQGGLLDLALSPDFQADRQVYFTYASGDADANRTVLARGRLDDGATALNDIETLFHARPNKSRTVHYGGRILFLPDGTLLLSIGDGGRTMAEAQNLESHLGSVVRLNPDGSAAADNPFLGRDDALPEIWTWGHRNIQGLALHPETGAVWSHEHGPRGGDEINVHAAGGNYGWPEITYGTNYDQTVITEETSRPGIVDPLHHWVPLSIAPSGLAFYEGDAFPEWRGDLFLGALRGEALVRFEVEGESVSGEERLLEGVARIRDVRLGPDGLLYLLTDRDGRLLRLEPAE